MRLRRDEFWVNPEVGDLLLRVRVDKIVPLDRNAKHMIALGMLSRKTKGTIMVLRPRNSKYKKSFLSIFGELFPNGQVGNKRYFRYKPPTSLF